MDTSLFYLDAGDFFQPISSLQDRSQLWERSLYNEQHLPVALSADDRRKLGIPDQQPWNDDFQIYVNHDGYVTPVESCDQAAWDNGSICYFHPLSRRYRPLPGARPPRAIHLSLSTFPLHTPPYGLLLRHFFLEKTQYTPPAVDV